MTDENLKNNSHVNHLQEIQNLYGSESQDLESLNITLMERIVEIEEANYKIAELAGELEDKNTILEKETHNLRQEINGDIKRFIEFKEEDYEYGLSILSHFGKIIENKFPKQNIRVRIEQDASKVRMVIHSGNEQIETIERTLQEYGCVVSGQMSPEDYLENPFEAMKLRHKLENAARELSQTKDMYALIARTNNDRIEFLENQVGILNTMIANQLNNSFAERELILGLVKTQNDISPDIVKLLNKLSDKIQENEHGAIKELLKEIRDKSPSLFDKIESTFYGALANTTGSILYGYITSLK